MALFDNKNDNKEKGNNISKRIEKDINKKKGPKNKRRGMTKNSYIKHENKETDKNDIKDKNEDKYMDLDPK